MSSMLVSVMFFPLLAVDWNSVLVEPWTIMRVPFLWVAAMGFFVALACGLIGNYLILRRMALVGDAISHSVLPGLAIAFLLSGSLHSLPMLIGAVIAGIVTTVVIEFIHSASRVKSDAAIGITFTTMFAIGVILINVFASKVHLDPDCVLYGALFNVAQSPDVVAVFGLAVPIPIAVMAVMALVVILLIAIFYKELLVSSFDPALAATLGFAPRFIHYALMSLLSVVVVAAFEAVGAILVIAMLVLPGATALLLTTRLRLALVISAVHALLSAVLGMHLGLMWNCPFAAAIVIAGSMIFLLAWIFHPHDGLFYRFLRMFKRTENDQVAVSTTVLIFLLASIASGLSGCSHHKKKDPYDPAVLMDESRSNRKKSLKLLDKSFGKSEKKYEKEKRKTFDSLNKDLSKEREQARARAFRYKFNN